ncbi:MAG: TIGR00341 family protein [Planctomycetota bacterium]
MGYRRIDLTLPGDDEIDLPGVCEGVDLIDHQVFTSDAGGARRAILLVRDDEAEPTTDALADCFGERAGFRLTVTQLAAVIPRPDEDEAGGSSDAGGGDGAEDDKKPSHGRISREELAEDLAGGSRVSRQYLLMVLLSSVIAGVGLVRDAAAVVIGSMVIAPLLLPNMSLALGTALGDFRMILRSLWTNAAGVGVCLAFAVGVGLTVPFDPEVSQIASRTEVGYSDVALALAAGTAGAVAVTSGVSANLIGVMVAVALLPPMVALGLLVGGGLWERALGTGLLLAVNLACVNLAGVATFLARGVRPGRFAEEENARRASAAAIAFWLATLAGTVALIWLAQSKTSG